MGPDEYLQQRVDPQIAWYDRKSQRNQRWFKTLRILEIILAASIAFLAGQIDKGSDTLPLIVGVAGVLVAVISGLLSLQKYQENWVEYRTICESLRHHKFRYLTKADPYAGDTAFPDFVNNVEALISKENTNWAQYIKEEKKEVDA